MIPTNSVLIHLNRALIQHLYCWRFKKNCLAFFLVASLLLSFIVEDREVHKNCFAWSKRNYAIPESWLIDVNKISYFMCPLLCKSLKPPFISLYLPSKEPWKHAANALKAYLESVPLCLFLLVINQPSKSLKLTLMNQHGIILTENGAKGSRYPKKSFGISFKKSGEPFPKTT